MSEISPDLGQLKKRIAEGEDDLDDLLSIIRNMTFVSREDRVGLLVLMLTGGNRANPVIRLAAVAVNRLIESEEAA